MRKIRVYRERMGFTQVQVAERLGVDTQTVSRWETGARFPHRRHLLALAGVFNCSLADLFDGAKTA